VRLRDVELGDVGSYVRMRCDPVMMAELGGPLLAVSGHLLLIAVVNGFTLDETADEQPASDTTAPSQDAARDYIASLPPAQFPNLTAVAGQYADVDRDERFELLLDLFVGGLARRAATDEKRSRGRSK
jgi:hypothetical protein